MYRATHPRHGPSSASTTRLTNLVEVGGFAQASGTVAPTVLNGTIGSGFVNASLFQVGAGMVVTEWRGVSGSTSITSDPVTAPGPGFTSAATIACGIETMHVRFTVSTDAPASGSGTRSAAIATEALVPAIRLTYTR